MNIRLYIKLIVILFFYNVTIGIVLLGLMMFIGIGSDYMTKEVSRVIDFIFSSFIIGTLIVSTGGGVTISYHYLRTCMQNRLHRIVAALCFGILIPVIMMALLIFYIRALEQVDTIQTEKARKLQTTDY